MKVKDRLKCLENFAEKMKEHREEGGGTFDVGNCQKQSRFLQRI